MQEHAFVAKRVSRRLAGIPERCCGGVGWRVNRALGDGHAVNFLGPLLQVDEVKKVEYPTHPPQPLPWTPYYGLTRVVYVLKGGLEWKARHPARGDRSGTATVGDAVVLSSRGGAVVQQRVADGVDLFHAVEVWVKEPVGYGNQEPLMDTYAHKEFPKYEGARWTATVLLGTFDEPGGTPPSPVETCSAVRLIDFSIEPGGCLEYPVPAGWTTAVYVYQGAVELQNNMEVTPAGTLTTFERPGNLLDVAGREDGAEGVPARFLLIAAAPFTEGLERAGTVVAASRGILDDVLQRRGIAAAAANLQKLRRRQLRGAGDDPDPDPDAAATPQAATGPKPDGGSDAATGATLAGLQEQMARLRGLQAEGVANLEQAIADCQSSIDRLAGAAPEEAAPPASPTTLRELYEEMLRYKAEWQAYSAEWVQYLRSLHEGISRDPSDDALREEYNTKAAAYRAELSAYNEKVRIFNEKKRLSDVSI